MWTDAEGGRLRRRGPRDEDCFEKLHGRMFGRSTIEVTEDVVGFWLPRL